MKPVVVAALAAIVAGCVPRSGAAVELPDPSASDWSRLRAELAATRRATPSRPYVEDVTVAMREPRTGKVFQARGAVAVDPSRAARMILLGPGGATALDAWITDRRFRVMVPGIDYARRGGAAPAEARGLPVGFLRWWLLHPLDGRLLAAWDRHGEPLYLLRHGEDTMVLRDGAAARSGLRHVTAVRRDPAGVERLEWLGQSPARPHAGDRARYVDGATGLEVEVLVEAIAPDEPDPAAFLDPDAAAVAREL